MEFGHTPNLQIHTKYNNKVHKICSKLTRKIPGLRYKLRSNAFNTNSEESQKTFHPEKACRAEKIPHQFFPTNPLHSTGLFLYPLKTS